jgi:hypothetical protein
MLLDATRAVQHLLAFAGEDRACLPACMHAAMLLVAGHNAALITPAEIPAPTLLPLECADLVTERRAGTEHCYCAERSTGVPG